MPSLILASSSPRRAEILGSMGVEFVVRVADVDEERLADESAEAMVLRLAVAKARAYSPANDEIVLGADTAVVLGSAIFGKPVDEDDGLKMLAALSGNTHQVVTAVAVATSGGLLSTISATDVTFREIDPDEARDYWQSGEPVDKAGAYAIQGRGGMFARAIMGSYSGVVGLPVFETANLLREAGFEAWRTATVRDNR